MGGRSERCEGLEVGEIELGRAALIQTVWNFLVLSISKRVFFVKIDLTSRVSSVKKMRA